MTEQEPSKTEMITMPLGSTRTAGTELMDAGVLADHLDTDNTIGYHPRPKTSSDQGSSRKHRIHTKESTTKHNYEGESGAFRRTDEQIHVLGVTKPSRKGGKATDPRQRATLRGLLQHWFFQFFVMIAPFFFVFAAVVIVVVVVARVLLGGGQPTAAAVGNDTFTTHSSNNATTAAAATTTTTKEPTFESPLRPTIDVPAATDDPTTRAPSNRPTSLLPPFSLTRPTAAPTLSPTQATLITVEASFGVHFTFAPSATGDTGEQAIRGVTAQTQAFLQDYLRMTYGNTFVDCFSTVIADNSTYDSIHGQADVLFANYIPHMSERELFRDMNQDLAPGSPHWESYVYDYVILAPPQGSIYASTTSAVITFRHDDNLQTSQP